MYIFGPRRGGRKSRRKYRPARRRYRQISEGGFKYIPFVSPSVASNMLKTPSRGVWVGGGGRHEVIRAPGVRPDTSAQGEKVYEDEEGSEEYLHYAGRGATQGALSAIGP